MRTLLIVLSATAFACGDKGDDEDTGSESDDTSDPAGSGGCAEPFDFSEPGAGEYLQWAIAGVEYTSLPPAGGAYYFNTYLNVVLYASDYSGSLSFGSGNPLPDGLAAGTYDCAADGMFVNGGALGMASAQAPGSSCEITFTEAVSDGGAIVGTLWAELVDFSGVSTGCVEARFSLTDAPP